MHTARRATASIRKRFEHGVHADEQLVGRLHQEQRQGRVEHVGGGHASVQPAGWLPGDAFDVRQKRDYVVACDLFDLIDRIGIELRRL